MKNQILLMYRLFIINLLIFVGLFFWTSDNPVRAAETIRVGIFQNKPIVYFEDEPKGLFVEVLNYVAEKEGWDIDYVTCELKECLQQLESNKLDIMTSLGESPERLDKITFSKVPVWTFWGTIYSNDHNIHSVFDLSGKKIGIRSNNNITKGLQKLLSEFNIPVIYFEYDNYESAYEAFKNKYIDAIAVNNTYGFDKQKELSVHKTPIVFSPFSAYFAAPKNGRHEGKLSVIDEHVKRLLTDDTSLISKFYLTWFGGHSQGLLTAKNIGIISTIFIALTIIGMSIWRYFSLLKINSQLFKNIEERRRAESALQEAHSKLEIRVAERTQDLRAEIENRKLLEENLSREKTFLEAVLNNISDGVVACNKEGVLTLFNRSTREIHGLPEKPIPADKWADYYNLYLADGKTKMDKSDIPLFRALKGENVKDIEMVIVPTKGPKRILLAAGQPLISEGQELLGAVVSMHDVTEKKEAERLLLDAHQELERKVEQRTAELKLSYEKLEKEIAEREKMEITLRQSQKMEAIGTLAGGIAHDFNNLLGVITGNISYALSNLKTDDELYEVLSDVQESSRQAQGLTHQLLTFSKGGSPIKKVVDINRLIKESVLFSTRGAKVNCSFELPDDLWPAEVDEGQINQVIGNLVINANQAMPNGGTIKIRTENVEIDDETVPLVSAGQYIKISIEDQGVGISKKHLSNIFEPYFTTKQKGSGLGLATTYSIIKRHGGHIAVYSEIEKGTVFNVYLPAALNAVIETKDIKNYMHIGQGNILIMDDQEPILKMVEKMLERMGYEATLAIDGHQAIEMYREAYQAQKPFDLVILDLTIPGGMGGTKTLIELLKIDSNVKAIVSSGYSNDPVMSNYKDYGFCGIVPKPYTQSQLAEVLNKIFYTND